MNYFDSNNTNEILSLDDVNVQKELEKLSYEKYLRDEFTDRTYNRKSKRKRHKKKSGVHNE